MRLRRMVLVRVLVVDDVEDWRKSISLLLKEYPTIEIVGEASDGVCAVQMAQEMQPTVILLDIGLPRLDGIQVAGWIRTLSSKSKIIFVSQHIDLDVVDVAIDIGVSVVVLISEIVQSLISAIQAAIRREKFMSNQLVRYLSRERLKD